MNNINLSTQQKLLLNEILIQPSNQILKNRFIEESDANLRCNGICQPGMCTFSA